MARILVVEDDAYFGESLRLHLTALGHKVTLTREPAAGIQSILESPPDLILSDLNMPYLTGQELLKAVWGEQATRHIPVVIVTGKTDDDSYLQAIQLGVSCYLIKPVLLADLMKAVQSALGRSSPKNTGSP